MDLKRPQKEKNQRIPSTKSTPYTGVKFSCNIPTAVITYAIKNHPKHTDSARD